MNLVTGYRGYAHVTSNDQAALHRAVFGSGHCIINTGSVFALTFADTDVIRISDGEAIIQGHHMRIAPGDHEDVQLTAGTTGNNRIDYIAIRYTKSAEGVESAAIVQICGTPVNGTASAPSLTQQDTNENGTVYEAALYRIAFTGLAIGTPAAVFTPVQNIQTQINNLASDLQAGMNTVSQAAQSNLNAAKQDLQNQINGKQATVTGGASTIVASNLTANRALVSNGSGKVAVGGATATDLSRIAGLTGNAQTQLDTVKAVLNGIGVHYIAAAAANLASKWEWTQKKFDNNSAIDDAYGNLVSRCSGGYWFPPKRGFCVAVVTVTFASNNKGSRGIILETYAGTSTSVTQTVAMLQTPAINHGQSLSVAAGFRITADEKLGLRVAQDSGSTLEVKATARVLFIPDM